MKLERQLAEHVLEKHPEQAVIVLERLDEAEIIHLLDSSSLASAAIIIERLSPHFAAAVVGGVKCGRAAQILDTVNLDSATRLLRRVSEERREALLAEVTERRARSLCSLLQFDEGSAGALMDPDVLALPSVLSAREALQRVRSNPALSRDYIYVVDPIQRLVGAMNLRELLLARGRIPLTDLMVRDPYRVVATADRASVLMHPGWKEVHALPVVDHMDAFLGAIRYRVFRQLEDEFLAPRDEDVEAGSAFAQVIAAGARGLLDAVTGSAERDMGRNAGGTIKRS